MIYKNWGLAAHVAKTGGKAMSRLRFTIGILLLLLTVINGCSSGHSSFVRTDIDFSYVQRVAILPFQNLSQDLHAGARMNLVFMSELLEQNALAVLDLGETLEAMGKLRLSAESALTPSQIVALGKELKVDAIFMGTIEEYGIERISNDRIYVITASFTMAETETGSLIWKSQIHENGTSFLRKLFGGGSKSLHRLSLEVIDQALGTLF